MCRSPSVDEQARLDWLESDAIHAWMDAGHGACLLAQDGAARIVTDALHHLDGRDYDLAAWCVMPNHVHVVCRPHEGCTLAAMLQAWKGVSAHRINRLLCRSGTLWQAESYDHLIRDHGEFRHAVQYVLENPVKARLRSWAWVDSRVEFKWS